MMAVGVPYITPALGVELTVGYVNCTIKMFVSSANNAY